MSNASLQPPKVDTNPGGYYSASERRFQGIPGIERSPAGRLWITFYAGGDGEGVENYVALVSSSDDGATWSAPVLAIDPPGNVRAFDPCLWTDPKGKLWLFWAMSDGHIDGRCGVWYITTNDSDIPHPNWTAPQRIANGIMMNKPTVLSDSSWLLPTALWPTVPPRKEMAAERFCNALVSTDEGKTFQLRGSADIEGRNIDEHMFVQHPDDTVSCYIRLASDIGVCRSDNGGRTWDRGSLTGWKSPGSRFFIRRLNSGRLLLVNHYNFSGRNNLTAMLSEDEGRTWLGGLLLDERSGVSYPDGIETPDGLIYIVYDRNRTTDMDILMAKFREEDILAGHASVVCHSVQ